MQATSRYCTPILTPSLAFRQQEREAHAKLRNKCSKYAVNDAEQGLTLIWPAGWTHNHRGRISKDKEKYIITGWFSFLKENQ